MEDVPVSLEDLRTLVGLFEDGSLTDVSVRREGAEVRLSTVRRRSGRAVEPSDEEPAATAVARRALPAGPAPERDPNPRWLAVRAPMQGIFYRAARPSDLPFVEPGDPVEDGQVVGLIEAMKTFSDIEAECAGTVAAIAAQNGEMVAQGAPLVWIDPAE